MARIWTPLPNSFVLYGTVGGTRRYPITQAPYQLLVKNLNLGEEFSQGLDFVHRFNNASRDLFEQAATYAENYQGCKEDLIADLNLILQVPTSLPRLRAEDISKFV